MATYILRGGAAYLNRDGLTAMTDAEWADKVDTSPSIRAAYERQAKLRVQSAWRPQPWKHATVFGEAKTRAPWDGTVSTSVVRREAQFTKRGTCPDKV